MSEEKYLILYHGADNDGVFSGALLYNHLLYDVQVEKEDITLVPIDYYAHEKYTKETIDNFANVYTSMFIVDFSLPLPLMEYAYKKFGNNFVWIDHHKPIIQASQKSKLCECEGVREIDRSAILGVYKYLYDPFDVIWNDSHNEIPKLLRILSAWDSFTYEQEGYALDYVRKINYGISHMFNLDIFQIAEMLEDFNEYEIIDEAHDTGEILVDNENKRMKTIIKCSGDFEWTVGEDNRKAVALFIQGPSNSRMFESVIDKVQNAIVFKRNSNSNWTVSLYNPNEKDLSFHCGEYCREKYKGGGHIGAAGFELTEKQFIKILKEKHI